MVLLPDIPESVSKIQLWSLVLSSVDISHEVVGCATGWQIRLADADYQVAKQQINIFEEENRNWPPPPPVTPAGKKDIVAGVFMFCLFLFGCFTGPWNLQSRWFAAGAVSAEKVLSHGEWWRLWTGLTLHADVSHLLANVFLGGLLLYFLGRQVGSGAATLLAVASGGIGNAANILFRQQEHLAVGFSTSVFGMVGALCFLRWLRYAFALKELLISLGAALALIAFLGSEGERTDLGAHFWGMAAGLLLGAGISVPAVAKSTRTAVAQNIFLLFSIIVIAVSWRLACIAI